MVDTQADAMRQTPEQYCAARTSEIAESLSLAQVRLLGLDQPGMSGAYEILHMLRYARERMIGVEQIARVLLGHYQAALRVIGRYYDAERAAVAVTDELMNDGDQVQTIEVRDLCDPWWIATVMSSSQRGRIIGSDGKKNG